MRYLIGLFFLIALQTATAGQCRVNGGKWEDVYRGSIKVKVAVRATPGAGRILLDGYTLECRYTPDQYPPSATDYWHTDFGSLIPNQKFDIYKVGLRVHSTDYPMPVKSGIHLATMRNNGQGVDLETYMYIDTRGTPGPPVEIYDGFPLGMLYLRQTNNTPNPSSGVIVHLIAGNSLIVQPSTCTINNNQPITVDFSNVDQTVIGESPLTSSVRKEIRLNYSCPDGGVNQPITIILKGITASFSREVLAMSNPNLGTGLLRNGVLVRPNGSFNSNIYNSSGGDNVVFALTRKPGSAPATGPFTGSGTLVMGVP